MLEYSARYGISDRALRMWVLKGEESGELPPLDDPGELPSWAEKHNTRVTDAMLSAAASSSSASKNGENLSDTPDLGQALDIARQNFAQCHRDLDDARRSGNRGSVLAAQRALALASTALWRGEKVAADLKKRGAGNLSREDVAWWFQHLIDWVVTMHDGLPRRIVTEFDRLVSDARTKIGDDRHTAVWEFLHHDGGAEMLRNAVRAELDHNIINGARQTLSGLDVLEYLQADFARQEPDDEDTACNSQLK